MDLEEQLKALREDVAKLLEQREAPRLLKYADAARMLSISPSKLKTLIRRGEIVPTLLGGRKMISRMEIDRVATPKRSEQPAPKRRRESLRAFDTGSELKKLKRR